MKLEGLEGLTELEEFYISHNGVERLEGLDNNVRPIISMSRPSLKLSATVIDETHDP